MAKIEKIIDEKPQGLEQTIPVPPPPNKQVKEQEIDLSESEKILLSNLHGEVQKMLHELGCVEMDFEMAKSKLKQRITEQKARLDGIIHDKIVLCGYRNVENLDIKIDFDNSKLKFHA